MNGWSLCSAFTALLLFTYAANLQSSVRSEQMQMTQSSAWANDARQRFHPITAEALQAQRTQLQGELAALYQILNTMPDGALLARDMHLAELERQLETAEPDAAALEEVARRLSRSFPKLLLSEVDTLRPAVRQYGDTWWLRTLPNAEMEFARNLDLLEAALASDSLESQTTRAAFAWLARTHLLDDQLQIVVDQWSHPNQLLRVQESYLAALASKPITQPVNMNDNVSGVAIRGKGTINAQPKVHLTPNATEGEINLSVVGQGSIALTARKKPATLQATTNLRFHAEQTLLLTPHGIDYHDPALKINNRTSLRSVQLDIECEMLETMLKPVVKRIATKQLAESDPQAAAKIRKEIETKIKSELFVIIDQVNEVIERLFWQTIDARDVDPGTHVSSTTDELAWIGSFRSPWQLAALSPAPTFDDPQPQVVVQFHESVFNNTSAIMAGKRMNEVLFEELVLDSLRLQPDDTVARGVRRIPAAFTFDNRQPFDLRFANDQVHATLRIASFELEDHVYVEGPVHTVQVSYRARLTPEGVIVERDGPLRIEPSDDPHAVEFLACMERFLVPSARAVPAVNKTTTGPKLRLTHRQLDLGWLSLAFESPELP